jgi:hypothetical protein
VAPSYASVEGFIAAKVMVEGLRRAGPRLRTGTEYIDITIINRNGMFVR